MDFDPLNLIGLGADKPTTPKMPLHARVRRHCRKISVEQPVLLPFTRIHPNHVASFCHLNARHQVREHGGDVVHGWMIWESKHLIDAEFHAVWRDPDGNLIDVTPRPDGEHEILFLPDRYRRIKAGRKPGEMRNYANRTDSRIVPFTVNGGIPFDKEWFEVDVSDLIEVAESLGLPTDPVELARFVSADSAAIRSK